MNAPNKKPAGRAHRLDLFRALISLSPVKAVLSSMIYYVHEHVVWRHFIHAHPTARIHSTASIRNPHNVYVGRNAHINHLCSIWAGETSKIVLGEDLLMGPGVCMHAGNHGIVAGTPMTLQPRRDEDIIVGDDVWLGAGVVVTGGVRIAKGVLVAAGAVVTKSIDEPYAIAGGIPARVIGYRPAAPQVTTS